jgi:hypothetical protein
MKQLHVDTLRKGIDKDIEQLSKTCQSCTAVKINPAKVPVRPWDEPNRNWGRKHIDYAGPFQDYYFFIVVDAKSRWTDIKICRNPPISTSTPELLSDIFATHGYPHVLVLDITTIFASDQFKSYC